MSAARLIARVELRRRWGSFVALSLLVALVAGAVLAGLNGAVRTRSSVDRFRDRVGASDASFQAPGADQAAAMVGRLQRDPHVEAVATRYLVNAWPAEESGTDIAIMSDPSGEYGTAVDRPLVLHGRLPRDDAPDEIMLNELAARLTGLRVGDRVDLESWSSADLDALAGGADGFGGFHGPPLHLAVVGIGRVPEELTGDVRRTSPFALGSRSFLSGHPGIGAWPPAVYVRLRNGTRDLPAVAKGVASAQLQGDQHLDDRGAYRISQTAKDVYLDASQRSVDTAALGLALFALGALFAGAIAVGQALQRQLAASVTPAGTAAALGATRSGTALAATLPVALAGVVGILGGVALTALTSGLVPAGLARRAEVDRGVWLAPGVVLPGAALFGGVLVGGAYLLARRRHARRPAPAPRSSFAARTATRANAPVSVVTGIRLANDRGRSGAISMRSALVGLAVGFAGVVAAGVVVVSLADLGGHPARWGWNWSSSPDYFGDANVADVQRQLAADPRVSAVGTLATASLDLNDVPTTGAAISPVSGDQTFTVTSGRAPVAQNEIALGRQTMSDLRVTTGDDVTASRADGSSVRLRVVGTVLLPATYADNRADVGAVLTPDGLGKAQHDPDTSESMILTYARGQDRAAVEAGLAADHGLAFTIFAEPNAPGTVRSLSDSRSSAVALAAFFAALAAIGLFHALVLSTRRRRPELAVLRALGLRRRSVRSAVRVEALTLTAIGAAIGIPVGIVLGRLAWRAMVGGVAVVSIPRTPWGVIGACALAGALAAVLLAWWPARRSTRRPPSADLRME